MQNLHGIKTERIDIMPVPPPNGLFAMHLSMLITVQHNLIQLILERLPASLLSLKRVRIFQLP